MRIFLVICVALLGGCGGLKVQCEMDEALIGRHYARHYVDTDHFERFQKQCERYGYKVPSTEKFKEAFTSQAFASGECETEREYFMASYRAYRRSQGNLRCRPGAPIEQAIEQIRKDALDASAYKSSVEEKESKENRVKTKDMTEAVVVGAIAAPFWVGSYFAKKSSAKKLKALAEKYNYNVSDLE